MQDKPEDRGNSSPRAIAELVARLTRRPLGRRGFSEAALVAEWPAIVGPLKGNATLPLKISFPPGERTGGTLHVRVATGGLATELQHQEPLIVERINGYFGYGAVSRLKISQGHLPPRPLRRPPAEPPLDAAAEGRLQAALTVVEDAEIRTVLAGLGRRLAARR